jgi:hypothetical protein
VEALGSIREGRRTLVSCQILRKLPDSRRIDRELHGVLKLREQEGESPERSWLIGISTFGITEFSRSRRSGHFKFRNSERKSEPSI